MGYGVGYIRKHTKRFIFINTINELQIFLVSDVTVSIRLVFCGEMMPGTH